MVPMRPPSTSITHLLSDVRCSRRRFLQFGAATAAASLLPRPTRAATTWGGIYVTRQWMDDWRVRRRLATADWMKGAVVKIRWTDIQPTRPDEWRWDAVDEAIGWLMDLPWRPYAVLSVYGTDFAFHPVTGMPDLPAWTYAPPVQTYTDRQGRTRIVPFDPTFVERRAEFVRAVAEHVLPMTPRVANVPVTPGASDAEMMVTRNLTRLLREQAGLTDHQIEDGYRALWRDGCRLFREAFRTRISLSPGNIWVGRRLDRNIAAGPTGIVEEIVTAHGRGFLMGNGNMANYPGNSPSQFQLAYGPGTRSDGRCMLIGYTETPEGSSSRPAVDLDDEFRRVAWRETGGLGYRRITLHPDAAALTEKWGDHRGLKTVLREAAARLAG